jgi:hypothetical protein
MAFLLAMTLFAAQTGPSEPIYSPQPEAVRTLHEFSGCIVRQRTSEARAVLAMDFRTPAYRRRLQELARSSDGCFEGNVMSMGNLPFAGSLAEQLFLRSHAATAPSALLAGEFPQSRSRSEALSYCVVQRAPAEARAVLDTAVTSPEEAAALNALRPAIAACLEGQEQAQLNRLGLRSLIAIALYHLGRRSEG